MAEISLYHIIILVIDFALARQCYGLTARCGRDADDEVNRQGTLGRHRLQIVDRISFSVNIDEHRLFTGIISVKMHKNEA